LPGWLTLVVLFLFGWQFFWKVYNAILLGFLAVLLAIVSSISRPG
jgi:hypothetical protein